MPDVAVPEQEKFTTRCPKSFYPTEGDAIGHWRECVDAEGLVVDGALSVNDDTAVDDDDEATWGKEWWRVEGFIAAAPPPDPLPVFVPSREAVEAAAERIGREIDPTLVWATAPANVKNKYAMLALAGLTTAGHHLVADSAVYIRDNSPALGLPATMIGAELGSIAADVRSRLL